ncbi:haloacid dehalogenase superfamily protein [Sporobolomyces salmoneus]|uniref:haloacid dehalogenase superfamily protein n=1 Tax=Sporobolomyces salmoneus TaxID=183962 RepID=UPI00316D2188
MTHPQVNAVIFDMDGLLIDSEAMYTRVSNEVLKPYGKEMTWEIKSQLMGRPAHDAARILIELTGVPLTVEEVLNQSSAGLERAFKEVQPLPGVMKLVKHLEAHKIPMAIATGSMKKNFLIKSAHLPHLFDPFGDKILCGDDPRLEGKGKPDPTIFIESAKMLGITGEEARSKVLVFEDGAPGVMAARAAGMEVVWIPDLELVKTLGDEHGLNPSHTHESLEAFQPEAWGLPAYA